MISSALNFKLKTKLKPKVKANLELTTSTIEHDGGAECETRCWCPTCAS